MQWTKGIQEIQPLYEKAMKKAKLHQDNLIKPMGSLGRLEEIAIQIAGITGNIKNSLDKKTIVIMCADNGVYEENVSPAPQEVTKTQSLNFLKGITGVAVLAKLGGIDLNVIDIGINAKINEPGMISKKIAYGTKNITKGPAMTEKECSQAIETGFLCVKELKEKGCQMIGTGEMGIGNTTTAAAVIGVLTGHSVDDVTGKGAGITKEMYEHKKKVILKALCVNKPDKNNPLDVIQKVGGFDIAGLMGCFLGAAYYRVPIVIDGVISMAAALGAFRLNPLVKGFLLPSHSSEEAGYLIGAKEIGLIPYFNFNMRLGEGSGCPFTFYAADAAMAVTQNMVSFEQGNVDKSKYVDIREEI